jgi:hypothetical protein
LLQFVKQFCRRTLLIKLVLQTVCGVLSFAARGGSNLDDPWQVQRIFPLSSVSRPALGPTQPPAQWVPGVLSPGVKRGRGVMLTTHPHLVLRSRMSSSYSSSPPKRRHGV